MTHFLKTGRWRKSTSQGCGALTHDDRDHLYKRLGWLKAKLAGATHVDAPFVRGATAKWGTRHFSRFRKSLPSW